LKPIANENRIAFDRFSLDLVNECLWRGREPLKIRPKAFALLHYLLQRPGQMVTKDELLNAVWPQTFVGDAVLKVTVQQVREALEDDPKSPQFIETAHRRGYRFIGRVGAPPLLTPDLTSRDNFYSGAFPVFSDVVGRQEALARLQR